MTNQFVQKYPMAHIGDMPTENPFEALGRNPIITAAANQKLDDTAASETRVMC